MIYLILSAHDVTAVVDDPDTPEMQSILKSIRGALLMDILNSEGELQHPEAER